MKNGYRQGQTLIEVVIATMIAAMTTTAVFSVILSSFVSGAKADKRDAAAMILRRAQETLKSYVSGDPTNNNMFPGLSPIRPGAPGSPAGHWPAETGNTSWALSPGSHDVSSLLTGTPLENGGSSLVYTVSDVACLTGIAGGTAANCKTVVFTLVYPD